MQLSEKITTPEDLLKVDDLAHSAFMKECENLFGPLSDDTFWKYREHLRVAYLYTPINIKGKPFHFIHLNKSDPNLIAFTSNDKIGKKDGKTFIKPGKYLAQYSDLDNEQIKTVVTNYKHEFVPPELFYADSADEVVRIYEEGPNSCMRGKDWKHENHPTRIYFGPDTKMAFIKNKQGTGISARSLIRTDTTPHEYVKIYGDSVLMKKAFTSAGIVPVKNGLSGCRFPLIWVDGDKYKNKILLMPYIDGGISKAYISKDREDRKYMMLGLAPNSEPLDDYWKISATPTGGYQRLPDVTDCGNCGKLEFKEEIAEVNGSQYCKACSSSLNIVTVQHGNTSTKRMLLEYLQERTKFYFKVNGIWYTRNGLQDIEKFYDVNVNEVIDFADTGIDFNSKERFALSSLLVLNTSGAKRFFNRGNQNGLMELFIKHDTFEFYSVVKAKELIAKGATDITEVNTRLDEMLIEMRLLIDSVGSNHIPTIVDTLTEHPAKREFLRLYLEHVNGGSSYL